MTLWLRYYFEEDDTLSHYEFGEDGYARRQVDLRGPDRRPVTAAVLDEVLHARDHGGIEAVQAYESKYGFIAEGVLDGWRDVDQVVEISAAEFERAWTPARCALNQSRWSRPTHIRQTDPTPPRLRSANAGCDAFARRHDRTLGSAGRCRDLACRRQTR